MVSLKLCFPFNFNLEEGHEGEEDIVEEYDLEYDTKLLSLVDKRIISKHQFNPKLLSNL